MSELRQVSVKMKVIAKDEVLDAGKVGDFVDIVDFKVNAQFDPSFLNLQDFVDKTLGKTADWQKKFLEEAENYKGPNGNQIGNNKHITLKQLSEMKGLFEQHFPKPSPEELVEILRRDVHRLNVKLQTSEDALLRKTMFLSSHISYKPAVNDMILEMFSKMRVLAEGGTISKFELETLVAKIETNLNDDNTATSTVTRLRKILEDTSEVV